MMESPFKRQSHAPYRLLAGAVLALLLGACGSSDDASEDASDASAPAADVLSAPASDAPSDAAAREARAVVSDTLPYGEVGDELVYGHFAFPSDMVEPLPAVIIVHERWGLNDEIKEAADRLASQGYIVLAVDLFEGNTTYDVRAARDLMLRVLDNQAQAEENLRQALDFVATTAGAPGIATVGWGFGGGWALNASMLFPDKLDATVVYYGQVSDDPDRLAPIVVPVLGFFGERDLAVRVEDVRAFESTLESLGKQADIRILPEAGHGFANPEGRNYNAELAEGAWEATLVFLAEVLEADES